MDHLSKIISYRIKTMFFYQWIQVLCVWSLYISHTIDSSDPDTIIGPWSQPVIPINFKEIVANEKIYARPMDKRIPKNIWIGFREIPPMNRMYPHMNEFMSRAKKTNWVINMMDERMKDEFMKKYYQDSALYWAFLQINQKARIAAGDIWRYSALYAFGGFYIDDDAYIQADLDKVIEPKDRMIFGIEGNDFQSCYIDSYNLSEYKVKQKYHIDKVPIMFHNKSLLQWGMFVEPQHPIMLKLLTNIVDVIKREYFKKSVILPSIIETKFLTVLCATGSRIFTATVREALLDEEYKKSDEPKIDYGIRIAGKDFEEYGGTYKVDNFKPYSSHGIEHKHFSTYLKRHGINLLGSYHE